MPTDKWQLRTHLEAPKTYEEAPARECHTGRATMISESERFSYWNQHNSEITPTDKWLFIAVKRTWKRRILINYNWKLGHQIMPQIRETTVLRNATLSRKGAIIETMRIGLTSAEMHIAEMYQCSETDDNQSFEYGDIHEVMWNSTLSNILTFDDNDNLRD